jgi:hypothetical protein
MTQWWSRGGSAIVHDDSVVVQVSSVVVRRWLRGGPWVARWYFGVAQS